MKLKSLPYLELCRLGGDEFILIGDNTGIEAIDGVSYGSYEKEAYEDVSSAAKKADVAVYNVKSTKSGHQAVYELTQVIKRSDSYHEY